MIDDIRYSELVFLRMIAKESQFFASINQDQMKAVGLQGHIFVEMVQALIEDLYIKFHKEDAQLLVERLRGESGIPRNSNFPAHMWDNPRQGIKDLLEGRRGSETLCISYRGLRRIDELRDILRSERVLEEFGILLSDRYFLRDLTDDLARGADTPVSVFYIDMDRFKPINDKFGHPAGNVVMKQYLHTVRDTIEPLGTAYRGRGDEVKAFVTGQTHERAMEMAEKIRQAIANLDCEHNGKKLPKVSASIGVATTPPDARSADLETLAENRNRKAKEAGRNRVVGK